MLWVLAPGQELSTTSLRDLLVSQADMIKSAAAFEEYCDNSIFNASGGEVGFIVATAF
jgi:hypothetical protein